MQQQKFYYDDIFKVTNFKKIESLGNKAFEYFCAYLLELSGIIPKRIQGRINLDFPNPKGKILKKLESDRGLDIRYEDLNIAVQCKKFSKEYKGNIYTKEKKQNIEKSDIEKFHNDLKRNKYKKGIFVSLLKPCAHIRNLYPNIKIIDKDGIISLINKIPQTNFKNSENITEKRQNLIFQTLKNLVGEKPLHKGETERPSPKIPENWNSEKKEEKKVISQSLGKYIARLWITHYLSTSSIIIHKTGEIFEYKNNQLIDGSGRKFDLIRDDRFLEPQKISFEEMLLNLHGIKEEKNIEEVKIPEFGKQKGDLNLGKKITTSKENTHQKSKKEYIQYIPLLLGSLLLIGSVAFISTENTKFLASIFDIF